MARGAADYRAGCHIVSRSFYCQPVMSGQDRVYLRSMTTNTGAIRGSCSMVVIINIGPGMTGGTTSLTRGARGFWGARKYINPVAVLINAIT